MPQQTFFNLEEEKQKRIMDAAISEFAAKGYQGSSIQEIAMKAGVAKGSMYQYFENKKELFFYILHLAAQRKIMLVQEFMQNHKEMGFFEMMEALFAVGIRFSMENPELYRIYQDIQQAAPVEIRHEFEERMGAMGQQHYHGMMQGYMEKGEIRRDIGEDMAAYVVYTLLKNFGEFFMDKGGLEFKEVQDRYVSQFVDILRNGIKA